MAENSITKYSNKLIYSLKHKSNKKIQKDIQKIFDKINNDLKSNIHFLQKQNKKNHNHKHKHNGWKKVSRKKIFNGDKLDSLDLLKRKINGTLNKLNKDNFTLIKTDIINIGKQYNEEEVLVFIIDNLFKKAINQISYCNLYIQLYQEIINNLGSYSHLITNILIKKCNDYMETISSDKGNNFENNDEYEIICKIIEKKKYIYGYSQFIVELFNNDIIKFTLLKIFLDKLFINILEKRGEDNFVLFIELNLECINIILTKISKEIYISRTEINNSIIKYTECLSEYKEKTNLSSKNKFKIMDILEFLNQKELK